MRPAHRVLLLPDRRRPPIARIVVAAVTLLVLALAGLSVVPRRQKVVDNTADNTNGARLVNPPPILAPSDQSTRAVSVGPPGRRLAFALGALARAAQLRVGARTSGASDAPERATAEAITDPVADVATFDIESAPPIALLKRVASAKEPVERDLLLAALVRRAAPLPAVERDELFRRSHRARAVPLETTETGDDTPAPEEDSGDEPPNE